MSKLDTIPKNLRVPGLRFPDDEDKTLFIPDRKIEAIEKRYITRMELEAQKKSESNSKK